MLNYFKRNNIKKVVNKRISENSGRDLKEIFFLINSRIDIMGRIINNANIGSQIISNMAPTTGT
jgi:hypothetical protein